MTQTPAVRGCPVDESFDPLAAEFLADPFAVLAALPREERPVFFAPSIGYYVLTRYADIEQVFSDPASYSAAVAQAPLVPLVPEAQRILLGHQPGDQACVERVSSRPRAVSGPCRTRSWLTRLPAR